METSLNLSMAKQIYVYELPLILIDMAPKLIRDIDPVTVDGLKVSIQADGVLQPILVRPKVERFEIVFGNHRFCAAKLACLETIPAQIKTLSDEEALLLGACENIQRLEMNPLKEGEVFSELVKTYKVVTLAERWGKSVTYIMGRVELFQKLHPKLRDELGKRLTIGAALRFCKLFPVEQQLIMFERVEQNREVLERWYRPRPPESVSDDSWRVRNALSSPENNTMNLTELVASEEKAKASLTRCFECGGMVPEFRLKMIDDNVNGIRPYCPRCAPFVKIKPLSEMPNMSVSAKEKDKETSEQIEASNNGYCICPKCGTKHIRE
jgi:ParB/RepB/Spo0J family partition protein